MPATAGRTRFYSNAAWHDAALYLREALAPGHRVAGPAILIEPQSLRALENQRSISDCGARIGCDRDIQKALHVLKIMFENGIGAEQIVVGSERRGETQPGKAGGYVFAADEIEPISECRVIPQIGNVQRETWVQMAFQGFAEADSATAMPISAAFLFDDLIDHHVIRRGYRAGRIDIDRWRDAFGVQYLPLLEK